MPAGYNLICLTYLGLQEAGMGLFSLYAITLKIPTSFFLGAIL